MILKYALTLYILLGRNLSLISLQNILFAFFNAIYAQLPNYDSSLIVDYDGYDENDKDFTTVFSEYIDPDNPMYGNDYDEYYTPPTGESCMLVNILIN